MTMLAVPYLIETTGTIVNVSSVNGLRSVSSDEIIKVGPGVTCSTRTCLLSTHLDVGRSQTNDVTN